MPPATGSRLPRRSLFPVPVPTPSTARGNGNAEQHQIPCSGYHQKARFCSAWRPLLFADEDQAAKADRDPVIPAERSGTFALVTTPTAKQRRALELIEQIPE